MKKLNGVVFDGKFYEAEKGGNCDKCDLRDECCKNVWVGICSNFETYLHGIHIFRLNQKITQKLNGEKPLKIRRK